MKAKASKTRRPAVSINTTRYMPPRPANDSWAGESNLAAALVCAIGYFMHLFLSEPTLNLLGFPYGTEEASTLAKIHPGNYFIIASLFILIFSRGNPIEHVLRIARQHTAFFSLLLIYAVAIGYWILRGPKGVGLLLDVHIVMPICAIVFSYAPRNLCKSMVILYACFAVLNSSIGVFEGATHTRILPFNSDWEVTLQSYFRASALMGHPLVNAAFTSVSLFIILQMRMPLWLKSGIFVIMLAALVAFGGRSSFGISVAGISVLGIVKLWEYFKPGRLTVMRLMIAMLAILLVPIFCAALLYGVLHSSIGERLMAYNNLQDDSAAIRLASWQVFNLITPTELIFGIDGDRVVEIGRQIGVIAPTSDIENPWILMLLFLGLILFPVWLGGLMCFIVRLMAGAPLALQIAVVDYFLISATSNSFGRKDPIFMLLPGMVVCVKRLEKLDNIKKTTT